MTTESRSKVQKKEICECLNSKSGKEVIVIKIETCCKRSGDQKSKQQVTDAETEPDENLQAPVEQKRLLKLPLLVDRHHGPGCAMEISVLEKHEDSCMYKKDDVEGRSVDDRVGSYECVGRLVFRTCNPRELEPDPGINGGVSGNPDDSDKTNSNRAQPSQAISQRPYAPSSPSRYDSPRASRQASKASQYESVVSFGLESPEPPLRGEMVEEDLNQEQKQRLEAAKRRLKYYNDYHMLMGATRLREHTLFEKHYPGDNCKLQLPRNPLLMGTNHFDKIYSAKKAFPGYSDEGNQTDSLPNEEKLKVSLDTITSLTDLSRPMEKKKPSFFGSLFRRNSVKTSSYSASKSYKR